MIKLFYWFIPSRTQFITSHQQTDTLKQLATDFMNQLEGVSGIFFAVCVGIGLLGAIFYYYILNNFSHRMYKISKWVITLIITILYAWGVNLLIGFSFVSTELDGTKSIVVFATLPSFLWTFLAYLVASFLFCNLWITKTNAYRFLAIKR